MSKTKAITGPRGKVGKVGKNGLKRDGVVLGVLCAIFFVYAFTLIFPFGWITYNSVRTPIDFATNLWGKPSEYVFSNYPEVLAEFDLFTMFSNSLIICVAVPTLSIFVTACLAYALTKFDFKANKVIYVIAISNMFIPVAGSLASLYKLMSDTNLIDTHIGFIVMSASGVGFNFLLLHATFKNVSPTYAEAASIDGAGMWRTFLQIVMPQVMPICTSIWLLSFIGVWNSYETPYLFLRSYETIAVGVKRISDGVAKAGALSGQYPKLFCAILITTLPMVILFLAFQRKIMEFSMGGGIKE